MIEGINHLTLSVSDLDRAFAFYTGVLDCRPLARWHHGAYLLAGETTWICLTLDAHVRTAPLPEYTHIAFSITQDAFAEAVRHLRASGARSWKENASEGDSVYFLDPDGHKLELHVGDWRSRMQACREQPYDDMIFF
ncbi:MAG TPA: fosfomycin resistance glutathione transferase [Rhodanobacteraceae bacterium]|nr:fosfomycin resistance glutathione transferase [Rhodanobacteraceae bacterium]